MSRKAIRNTEMSTKRIAVIIYVLAVTAIFLLGIGVRRVVFEAQEAPGWEEVPYTLESALHFRMVRTVSETGRLPNMDVAVEYPNGVAVAETYTVGDEWVFAGLSKLLPARLSLTSRLRWISVLWFCMGIVFVALWIAWLLDSRWAGCVAATVYAVMPASVVRSTGQELSRENFAMPLLLAHLSLDALLLRLKKPSAQWLAVFGSAGLLAIALCTWDLIRFYIIVLWLVEAFRLVVKNDDVPVAEPVFWRAPVQAIAVLAAGCLNPYLRSHSFLSSPTALLGIGIVLAKLWMLIAPLVLSVDRNGFKSRLSRLAWLFLPLLLVAIFASGFTGHYGHFWDLLTAKLRFLNEKPLDPGLIGFDASILWVPALHSASARIIFSLFPATLLLTFVLYVLYSSKFFSSDEPGGGFCRLAVFYAVTFIFFLLFVRFHVLLAVFTAGIMGCGICFLARDRKWKVIVAVLLTGLICGFESYSLWRHPGQWGRPSVYYSEMKELIDWVDANLDEEPVLANFGIGSAILTYAGNPIILHPKFEDRNIRQKVREYGNIMFKGSESDLRNWMGMHNTRYLVYSMGEFSELKPEWQMRYFVDALEPPPDAPARLFEFRNKDLNIFSPLWGNRKYKVFAMRTRADESRATEMAEQALEALQSGQLQQAEDLAAQALLLYPGMETAEKTLRHVGALKDEGFELERE